MKVFGPKLAHWMTFSLAAGLFAACGAPESTENAIGEGASYLVEDTTTGEDPSAAEAGAEGAATDGELDAQAEEGSSAMSATPPEAGDEPCDFSALKERVLRNYDVDGDGRLSAAERLELAADLRERRADRGRLGRLLVRERHVVFSRVRWAFDADSNGALDETERATLVDAMESRCRAHRTAILNRYDANQDGRLDVAERAQLRADRAARHAERWSHLVERYDTSGDGALDKAELKAGLKADFIARRQEVKDSFDADGDGHLSDAEIEALKAAIREAVANGGSVFQQITGQS
jgi:Ca2+-binding EF-hand superfamily protein